MLDYHDRRPQIDNTVGKHLSYSTILTFSVTDKVQVLKKVNEYGADFSKSS